VYFKELYYLVVSFNSCYLPLYRCAVCGCECDMWTSQKESKELPGTGSTLL